MDVAVLNAAVQTCYAAESNEVARAAAYNLLRDWKDNPDTWLQVPHILQNDASSTHTKFFALQVLEDAIKYRWNALPVDQRAELRGYISDSVANLTTDEASFRSGRLCVNKLNFILVQIVKQDPPAMLRTFIHGLFIPAGDIIHENCMVILKLLSEEVFDFSRGEMTQQKIKQLKELLNSESQLIHESCVNVLSTSQKPELIRATLSAVHAYLSWIPSPHFFDPPLLETLLQHFSVEAHKNLALQCLSEVAARNPGDLYNMRYVNMYSEFITMLQAILPLDTDIPAAYSTGTSEDQAFIQNLALFFTSFFKLHKRILESAPENVLLLRTGLEYLTHISYVDDNVVFKVCLAFWDPLVLELCESHHHAEHSALITRPFVLMMNYFQKFCGGTERQNMYSHILSRLRRLMISRMTKPEEALIAEDENENIDHLEYKLVRKTLINLLDLDPDDTEQQILSMLSEEIRQLSSKLISTEIRQLLKKENRPWDNLNTLCCAIGSISGSMGTEQENGFLVRVLKDLCSLCAIAKDNDYKAAIATNIMYVATRSTRFLMGNWTILKIIVRRLFEYMNYPHPGLKDLGCETFIVIAQQLKFEFVYVQPEESEPFLYEILLRFPTIVEDLEPRQFFTFYEAVGCMVQAEPDPQRKADYLERLMDFANKEWPQFIAQARQGADVLMVPNNIRYVLGVIQANTVVATSLGSSFLHQFSRIFSDMLEIYRMYSELVPNNIALRTELRSVKKAILILIETFLDKAENLPGIVEQFVLPMMDPVVSDYGTNAWGGRESEVLSLFAMLINKYKVVMQDLVAPHIFEAVFQGQGALELITMNFEADPEHCLKFFALVFAIAQFCDRVLIQLSIEKLKLVMDLVIWAIRHMERNIAETGLNLLLEMLKKFQKSDLCNQFYKTYFIQIEQEIFAVLTDTFHRSGFKLHVLVLQHLFSLVENGSLTESLWDTAMVPHLHLNNAAFVRVSTIKLLSSSFPNMTTSEVTQFVNGLSESRSDLGMFKNSIRDFVIQSKQFSADQDNKDLYVGEADAHMERERICFRFLDLSLPTRLKTLILRKSFLSESDLVKKCL